MMGIYVLYSVVIFVIAMFCYYYVSSNNFDSRHATRWQNRIYNWTVLFLGISATATIAFTFFWCIYTVIKEQLI